MTKRRQTREPATTTQQQPSDEPTYVPEVALATSPDAPAVEVTPALPTTEFVTADMLGYEVTAPSDHSPHTLATFLRDLKIVHEQHRRIGPVTITFPRWSPALMRDR